MRYIKFVLDTPYAGTREEHYEAFSDETTDQELDRYTDELLQEHAEQYEYLVEGRDAPEPETEEEAEEREAEMEDYYLSCYGNWEEVDKEEYEENCPD